MASSWRVTYTEAQPHSPCASPLPKGCRPVTDTQPRSTEEERQPTTTTPASTPTKTTRTTTRPPHRRCRLCHPRRWCSLALRGKGRVWGREHTRGEAPFARCTWRIESVDSIRFVFFSSTSTHLSPGRRVYSTRTPAFPTPRSAAAVAAITARHPASVTCAT